MRHQAMKCPKCKEIATFTYHCQVPYSARVVLTDGEVAIDHDNGTGSHYLKDVDNCICDNCGRVVPLDDIDVVEVQLAGQR